MNTSNDTTEFDDLLGQKKERRSKIAVTKLVNQMKRLTRHKSLQEPSKADLELLANYSAGCK